MPPMKSALRFMSRWWAVIVAAMFGPVTSMYCTASRVVMCSSTTLSWGKRSTSGPSTSSMKAFSRSKTSIAGRSEEHTSELQSQSNLVCRLLLEKKKTAYSSTGYYTITRFRSQVYVILHALPLTDVLIPHLHFMYRTLLSQQYQQLILSSLFGQP